MFLQVKSVHREGVGISIPRSFKPVSLILGISRDGYVQGGRIPTSSGHGT